MPVALNMLTLLRELEESARVPLSDGACSDRTSQSRIALLTELSDVLAEASFSTSVVWVGRQRESVLVSDEEDEFNVEGDKCLTPGSVMAVVQAGSQD